MPSWDAAQCVRLCCRAGVLLGARPAGAGGAPGPYLGGVFGGVRARPLIFAQVNRCFVGVVDASVPQDH